MNFYRLIISVIQSVDNVENKNVLNTVPFIDVSNTG